jgi:hypothetical protein
MIRCLLYLFAVALVMLLYVAAYFIALKPLPVRSARSASHARSEVTLRAESPGRSGPSSRPEPNHHQPHRTAVYDIPFIKPTALPAGFWPTFFAPVQYVDAHWIRPDYWGMPRTEHP